VSGTYTATGINLKAMPMGENDRLMTILTCEYGLIRAIAPGARKTKSSLGGRTSLFVVNQLFLAKGRSLDKITQAETVTSYAGLAADLDKLAASQYLAEIVLAQALSDVSQTALFQTLNIYLERIEMSDNGNRVTILIHLCQGIFQLLILGGIAPQVDRSILTQQLIQPDDTDAQWRIGFSIDGGGIAELAALANDPSTVCSHRLTAAELDLLQQLESKQAISLPSENSLDAIDRLRRIEQILRQYLRYHLNLHIASAGLMSL
jgi:DNA repair protein RecO (recombination protein O)